MTAKMGRPREPVLPRFLEGVTVGHPSGCWLWGGSKNPKGYGIISVDGRYRLLHRVTYEMFRGPIPAGRVLDHTCRTPACCWPGHLDPVTHAVNIARGTAPSALANQAGTCVSGKHDMTDVYVTKGGRRQCRPCQLERGAEYRANRRKKDGEK